MTKKTNRKPTFTKDELIYMFLAIDELLITGLGIKDLWDENDDRYEKVIENFEKFFNEKEKEKNKEILLKIHEKLLKFISK